MTYEDLLAAPNAHLHRSDLGSVAARFVELANAQICRRVHVSNTIKRETWTLTGPEHVVPADFIAFTAVPLSYLPAKEFYENRLYTEATGESLIYTLDGDTLLVAPGGAQELRVTYRAITPLDADNTTTNTLTKHPDLFLWAVLAEACDYIQDPELEVKYRAKFDEAIRSVNNLHDWSGVT